MEHTVIANLGSLVKLPSGTTYHVDISPKVLKFDTVKEKLHAMYKLIGCDTIEVSYTTINGQTYTLFSDENAKQGPWVPTYVLRDEGGDIYDIIAGNFLIAKEDDKENILEMSRVEQEIIMDHLRQEMLAAREKLRELKEKHAN